MTVNTNTGDAIILYRAYILCGFGVATRLRQDCCKAGTITIAVLHQFDAVECLHKREDLR
jgi:hypothetical protein